MYNNDSDELSNLIVSRKLGKLKVSLDCEEIYSLDKLNYHLNYQNLIYPYVRLNNHKENNAPPKASGTVIIIINGSMKLSNWAARIK